MDVILIVYICAQKLPGAVIYFIFSEKNLLISIHLKHHRDYTLYVPDLLPWDWAGDDAKSHVTKYEDEDTLMRHTGRGRFSRFGSIGIFQFNHDDYYDDDDDDDDDDDYDNYDDEDENGEPKSRFAQLGRALQRGNSRMFAATLGGVFGQRAGDAKAEKMGASKEDKTGRGSSRSGGSAWAARDRGKGGGGAGSKHSRIPSESSESNSSRASHPSLADSKIAPHRFEGDTKATGSSSAPGQKRTLLRSHATVGGVRRTRSGRTINLFAPSLKDPDREDTVFGLYVRQESILKMRVYNWSLCDVLTMMVAVMAGLGCCFLLVVLSWSTKNTGTMAVTASLYSFFQDFFFRMGTISMIEFLLIMPCCACVCAGSSNSKVEHAGLGRDERIVMVVPSDEETCELDIGGRVKHVFPAGKKLGIKVGWRAVRVHNTVVYNGKDCEKALKMAHALHNSFEIAFNDNENVKEFILDQVTKMNSLRGGNGGRAGGSAASRGHFARVVNTNPRSVAELNYSVPRLPALGSSFPAASSSTGDMGNKNGRRDMLLDSAAYVSENSLGLGEDSELASARDYSEGRVTTLNLPHPGSTSTSVNPTRRTHQTGGESAMSSSRWPRTPHALVKEKGRVRTRGTRHSSLALLAKGSEGGELKTLEEKGNGSNSSDQSFVG